MSYEEVARILHQVLPAELGSAFLKVFEDISKQDDHAGRLQAVYDGAEKLKDAALRNAEGTGTDLFT